MTKSDNAVANFRTSNVAVFALFQINSVDAACLYSMVDDVNKENAETINIDAFATKYCGDSKYLFMILWEKYYTAIYNKESLKPAKAIPAWMKSKKYNVTVSSRRSSHSEVTSNPETDVGTAEPETVIELPPEPKHHKPLLPPSYLELLCFLLFFMSVKDMDLIRWIYWVFFYHYDIEPQHKHFYDLVDTMWGTNEKTKYKRNRAKTRVELRMKQVEVDEICPNKMKIIDIQSGGAWSKPLLSLRKTFTNATLGKGCWHRISQSVLACSENINESYLKLQDHYRLSEWSEDNPIIRGDRRAARKSLRQFLRVYKRYLAMPEDTDDGPNEDLSLAGVGSSLLESLGELLVRPFRSRSSANPDGDSDKEASRSGGVSNKSGATVGTTGTAQFGISGHADIKKRLKEVRKAQKNRSWLAPLFGGNQKVAEGGDGNSGHTSSGGGSGSKHDAATPLEIVYKESLTAPLSVLYSQSHTCQDRVKAMLRACEDELSMSRDDFMARYAEQVQREEAEALKNRGRVSRQVVVDVSSSESEGSGSGSGSEGEGEEFAEGVSSRRLDTTNGGDDEDEELGE